jgi:hypothetical protein
LNAEPAVDNVQMIFDGAATWPRDDSLTSQALSRSCTRQKPLRRNLASALWQYHMRAMGMGPPLKWPFLPPPPLSTTTRLGSLLGSDNPLPVAPPDNGLAALAGTTLLGSASSNPLSAAASDLFPPQSPYPYANALAALGALSPPAVGASSLLFGTPAAPTPPWHYVRWRFRAFLANLAITPSQREDGTTKQAGVRACLNRHYYGTPSETANSFLIGSWGKGTQVRPSRDIDILFLLPGSVWQSYQQRVGNKQSQLLQEVKEILAATYSQTTMRGDGQVISIPFNTIPVCTENLNPYIMVMKSAKDRV